MRPGPTPRSTPVFVEPTARYRRSLARRAPRDPALARTRLPVEPWGYGPLTPEPAHTPQSRARMLIEAAVFLVPPSFIVAGIVVGGWQMGGWEGALSLFGLTVVGGFVAGVRGDARL